MKRELGIARCGLACCLCAENDECAGCEKGECAQSNMCINRACSIGKGIAGCYACTDVCASWTVHSMRIQAFRTFIIRYGINHLLDCLERNEQLGIVYHRNGLLGDYDGFESEEEIVRYIQTGTRK